MTTDNSGDVRKYDGQPKPANVLPGQQFGESLDDIMPNEIEMPKRNDISAAPYTAIMPAPNYSIQKNTS